MNAQKSEISALKRYVFAFFSVLLILLALEFVLHFAGLERYDQEFMPKSSYPIFVPGEGERAASFVTSPHFGRFINNQSFLRDKPAGLTRIFVVGGSAAYGFPYTEEYGFSGYLRRSLDKAAPGRFEVVNASGMSFGSHRVLDVLRDVVRLAPDVVIIYSGNNEYVEQNVLPQTKTPPSAIRKISTLVDRTEIYRAIRLAIFRVAPKVLERKVAQDLTDIRSNPQVNRGNIGRSGQTDSTILLNYRANISAMRDILVQNGVKVIFCTVPVDLGGWIPSESMPQFANEADAGRWLELLDLRDEAFKSGELAQEAEYLRQILAITPGDSGMLFNYGKVLWMLRRYQESYQELVKAKDFDNRPIRALSSFNGVIRSMADEHRGVLLADLEGQFRERFLQGQAQGLFLDYCHLTEAGNKLVAEWLLPVLAKAADISLDIPALAALIRDDRRAESKDDFVRGHELYAQALTYENNARFDLAEASYLKALEYLKEFDQIYTNLGHIYADQNNISKAKDMYAKALQLNPKNHMVLLSLGYMSLQEGNFDAAEKYFTDAIGISSVLPGAYGGLGDVAMHRQDYQAAVKFYTGSLELGEDSVWLRKSLAQAYLALGDRQNAVRNWQEALRYSPFDQEIRSLLEKYAQP